MNRSDTLETILPSAARQMKMEQGTTNKLNSEAAMGAAENLRNYNLMPSENFIKSNADVATKNGDETYLKPWLESQKD